MSNVIFSAKNKALLLPNSNGTSSLFADRPMLAVDGENYRVIPHGIPETVLLRRLGYEIPNPMLQYYSFKGLQPFQVQRATCDLLTTNKRCYVLNDMGTGKTKTILWAWDYLNQMGLAGKLLILAPLSTLSFVWAKEVFATVPQRRCAVLHGSRAHRLKMLEDPATDIFILNHDGLRVIIDDLEQRSDIDCIGIDELAVFRNGGTTKARLLKRYVQRRNWVWGLTGAPMPNSPTDVWSQGMIVNPVNVPKYFTHCRDALMLRRDEFTWDPKPDAVEKAFAYLQPAVRFTLEDVTELPPVIARDIEVALTASQAKAYKEMATEYHTQALGKTINALNAGAAMQKLTQISGGWVYDTDHNITALDNAPRVEALIDIINASKRKVIVFAPFIHTVDGICATLTKEGIGFERITGGVEDREAVFTRFQGLSSVKVLVAHPGCMAHGLTLVEADTIVWFMPITSLDTYIQANARIRRVGQKFKQQIIHLVGTAVEKKLYRMLRTKQKLQEALLTLFEDASIMEVL